MTELEAINQMLATIGEAPVTDIEIGNPEVDLALVTLNQVSREVQAEGWRFNHEHNYSLAPNTDGVILLPGGIINISSSPWRGQSRLDLVVRDGKIYDRRTGSFQFAGPIQVNVTFLYGFEDLPLPFQSYVTPRASRLFAGRSQGSGTMVQFSAIDEERLRSNCIRYDTQQGRTNMSQDRDRYQYPTFVPNDALRGRY